MGVIRTHELLEARRIDGGEQAFAGVVDFGYTKTPEETLSIWGRGEAPAGHGASDPHSPTRRDRGAIPPATRQRGPRPPHGGGLDRTAGVRGRRRPRAGSRNSAFRPWRTRRYYYNSPSFNRRMEGTAAPRRRTPPFGSGLLRSSPGQVVRRGGGRESQHASQPGHGHGATQGQRGDILRIRRGRRERSTTSSAESTRVGAGWRARGRSVPICSRRATSSIRVSRKPSCRYC